MDLDIADHAQVDAKLQSCVGVQTCIRKALLL